MSDGCAIVSDRSCYGSVPVVIACAQAGLTSSLGLHVAIKASILSTATAAAGWSPAAFIKVPPRDIRHYCNVPIRVVNEVSQMKRLVNGWLVRCTGGCAAARCD